MAEILALVALFIWIFVIQLKQNEISDILKEIKSELKRKNETKPTTEQIIETDEDTQDIAMEILLQNSEPVSISDIPDKEVFQTRKNIPAQTSASDNSLPEKKENGLEKLFLGNIFNKIGALAIFVGLIIFIKLISPYIIFTPWMKLALGFLTGLGFIGCALKLQTKENLQKYSEVLLGTGFGTLFITTYCGSTVLGLLNIPTTLTVATVLLISAFYTADKLKTMSMLVISLIAGYLNPFFINSNFHVEPNFLFGYLIFVNLLGIIYTFRNKNRSNVNTINLILTFIFAAFSVKNILGPSILWSAYFIYDLICSTNEDSVDNKLLNFTNLAAFILFAMIALKDNISIGIAMTITGLLYGITAATKIEKEDIFKNYIHLFLTALTLAVFFFTSDKPLWRVYIWSAETILLSYFAEKYEYKGLANWAIGTFTASIVSTLCMDDILYSSNIKDFKPILNTRLCAFAPVILSGILSSKLTAKADEEYFKKLTNIFKFGYISIIYLYIAFEANDIINKMFIGKNTSAKFIKNMTNAILGFVYTIQFKRLHETTKFSMFEIAAGIIGIISIIYLLFTGCNYRPSNAFIPLINIRATAFLTAIGTSVLYAKLNKTEVFKYLAILLGFVLIHTEIKDTIDRFVLNNAEYLLSVGWILYAGMITAIGIFRDKQYLKFAGITLCIFAIIRIFIFDLAHVDILYKFIAFLTLGVILLILSYFYNKKLK